MKREGNKVFSVLMTFVLLVGAFVLSPKVFAKPVEAPEEITVEELMDSPVKRDITVSDMELDELGDSKLPDKLKEEILKKTEGRDDVIAVEVLKFIYDDESQSISKKSVGTFYRELDVEGAKLLDVETIKLGVPTEAENFFNLEIKEDEKFQVFVFTTEDLNQIIN